MTNLKATELTASTKADPEDIIYNVDDVSGTPTSKKIGYGTFLKTYNKSTAESSEGLSNDDLDFKEDEGAVLRYGKNSTPGTTDMTTPIQTALDVSGTARSRIVTLEPEDYKFSKLTIPESVLLTGQWPGGFASATDTKSTKLRQIAGTEDSGIIFGVHGAHPADYFTSYTGISNLCLMGDTTASQGSAITFASVTIKITNITTANPGVITTDGPHGMTTTAFITLTGVEGMTEINYKNQFMTVTGANTVSVGDLSSGFSTYTGAGVLNRSAIPQDYVELKNLFIRGWAENGIYFPRGGTPVKVENIVAIFNNGYVIRYGAENPSTSMADVVTHFDNISMDGNTLGGLYFENVLEQGAIILTGIKSEKRQNAEYSSVEGNDKVITFKDCDRVSVIINGVGSISSIANTNPGPVITIEGDTIPNISWNAVAVRTFAGFSGNPLLIDDNVDGRDVSIVKKHGSYNTGTIYREKFNPLEIADGDGGTRTLAVTGLVDAALGDVWLSGWGVDTQGFLLGQAYVEAAETLALRFNNETGGAINLAEAPLKFLKLPTEYFKASSTTVWDPPSTVDQAQVEQDFTVSGAALGDLAVFSHDKNLKSLLGFSYVSAADTITVTLLNLNAGSSQNVDSGNTFVATLNERAIKLSNTAPYAGQVLADLASVTTTVTVIGAILGDFVVASLNQDLQGVVITQWVSAADTVEVRFQNETGGNITLSAGTIRAGIIDVNSIYV